MTGIVRQLDSIGGVVIECSCAVECMKNNTELPQKFGLASCRIRKCILTGNPDHGNRCAAYPQDTTTWLIDENPQNIRQIPTNDGINRL